MLTDVRDSDRAGWVIDVRGTEIGDVQCVMCDVECVR